MEIPNLRKMLGVVQVGGPGMLSFQTPNINLATFYISARGWFWEEDSMHNILRVPDVL